MNEPQITVPDYFYDKTDILQLPTLSVLHYSSKRPADKMTVKLNCHMLTHVFHGTKCIRNARMHCRFEKGESLFAAKGQYVMGEILSREAGRFETLLVFFDDIFVMEMIKKHAALFSGLSASGNQDLILPVRGGAAWQQTMHSALAYLTDRSLPRELVRLKFEEIFLQLILNDETGEIRNYLYRLYRNGVETMRHFFECGEFGSVGEMMAKSNLPEHTFRELFQNLYATTPKQWLVEKRLEKARVLLHDPVKNVTDVCMESGFENISWFIQRFKNAYGITPKQFQKNQQNLQQNR